MQVGAAFDQQQAQPRARPRAHIGSPVERFEEFLRCPDCHRDLTRDPDDALTCECGYRAPLEGGVYRERQIFAEEEEIACTALPAVRVSLSALFA